LPRRTSSANILADQRQPRVGLVEPGARQVGVGRDIAGLQARHQRRVLAGQKPEPAVGLELRDRRGGEAGGRERRPQRLRLIRGVVIRRQERRGLRLVERDRQHVAEARQRHRRRVGLQRAHGLVAMELDRGVDRRPGVDHAGVDRLLDRRSHRGIGEQRQRVAIAGLAGAQQRVVVRSRDLGLGRQRVRLGRHRDRARVPRRAAGEVDHAARIEAGERGLAEQRRRHVEQALVLARPRHRRRCDREVHGDRGGRLVDHRRARDLGELPARIEHAHVEIRARLAGEL
jgi:hypothetical protein